MYLMRKTTIITKVELLLILQKEQEEIIKRRPSSQKGLSFAEIRQMEYLPKVSALYMHYDYIHKR